MDGAPGVDGVTIQRGYLGGWANYFKHGREARRKFIRLDYDVQAELLRWHKRRHSGRRTSAAMQQVLAHLNKLPRMVVPNNWCQRQPLHTAAAC